MKSLEGSDRFRISQLEDNFLPDKDLNRRPMKLFSNFATVAYLENQSVLRLPVVLAYRRY